MAIFDVPGAYLNADIQEDKFILLKIDGKFVGFVCKVNPKHKKDVCVESLVQVL